MLLSGNGRHRRPRPTPRLVIAAGVTGAGVALPLMGATGAHAATDGTWDKVALCESGNNWSLNTGNGFYGGLQFSKSTWEHYGGKQFAARPDLASRREQIAVAEKILADQGPGAWPACGLKAGLAKGGPAPETPQPSPPGGLDQHAPEPGPAPSAPAHGQNPGQSGSSGSTTDGTSTTAPGPSASSPGTGSSGTNSSGTGSSSAADPSGSASSSQGPKHAGPSADETPGTDAGGTGTDTSPGSAQGTGKHRADLDGNVLPDAPTQDDGTASGGTAPDATPSPTASPTTQGANTAAQSPSGDQYGLALGDNLARIAQGAHLNLPVQP
jgi:resuscitation-promoting factor RpfA